MLRTRTRVASRPTSSGSSCHILKESTLQCAPPPRRHAEGTDPPLGVPPPCTHGLSGLRQTNSDSVRGL
eukprot:6640730-Prorocentrum_lima.AAC.1